ncbi:MAG: septal ring lytic transglycosylase RlpA family protein [Chlorobi bacterium]|nr:septal ring lytic transglycosylase RlpA family protein [Chlorobiota bacterium]
MSNQIKSVLSVILILSLFASCSVKKKSETSKKEVVYQKGEASWYGPGFNGKLTASGEIFNMNKLTAAHKKLPFGTKVKVVNIQNGKSVIVKINDRGPFVKGRIIDLSKKAAQQIDLIKPGHAPVKIIILE